MPRLLRTASLRLAALYLGLFMASAGVLGAAAYVSASTALEQQSALRIETESAFLAEEGRVHGLDRLRAQVLARGRGAGALDYLVQDAAGQRVAGNLPTLRDALPGWVQLRSEGGHDGADGSHEGEHAETVRALVTDLGGGILLAVGDDAGRIAAVQEAIATAFAWTTGLAALLGIAGGVLLSRAFLARVDAIARTAEAIIAGDLARRIPLRGTGDDLDRLAATLNHMLDRIGALMDSLRQVSSDVAHDLRTPLTRLHHRLEDARSHASSTVEHKAAVDAASREAKGLLETFAALLRIAQVEGGSPRAGFRDLDLSEVADAVADAYRPDAEEAGHSLAAEVTPGLLVRGDRELLTQALANLVENALRHTPPGTRILLRLGRAPGNVVLLQVEDDGPGVPASDLPRLLRRFYRGERSRTTPGNGLGLSLVAAVAELHGATLLLQDAAPGLRVSLRFPPGAP